MFLIKLKETLTKLGSSDKVTVVTGDFSYDILNMKKNSIISEFLNLMYYSFLRPCILEPTRIVANKRASLIDNIFINTIDKKIDSGNIIDKVPDHMPDFILVKGIMKTKKYQRIKIRDVKNFNRKKYLGKLEEINTMLRLQYKNINEIFETFQN